MDSLIPIPALVVAYIAYRRGFREALVWGTLPLVLLMTGYQVWDLPGLPEVNLHNAPMLVAVVALVIGADRKLIKLDWIDLFVLAILVAGTISNYHTKDASAARNFFVLEFISFVAPYMVGKAITRNHALLGGSMVMLCALGAFIGYVSVYGARMSTQPLVGWCPLTAYEVRGEFGVGREGHMATTFRYGIVRSAGSFHHPIFMGMAFCLILPIAAWLMAIRLPRSWLVRAGIFLGCLAALILTFSRGPWMGSMIAFAVLLAGWSRYRTPLILLGMASCVVVAILAWNYASPYFDFTPKDCMKIADESERNTAYRIALLTHYPEVVMEQPWTGYGKITIPVIFGLESIDNEYLFMALSLGVPYMVLTLFVLIAVPLRLLRKLWPRRRLDVHARLGWCVMGGLFGFVASCITAVSGGQVSYVEWLVVGLGVGLLRRLDEEPNAALVAADPRAAQAAA